MHLVGISECESRGRPGPVVPADIGMVNLDVVPGTLMIMSRIENGNSETACGLDLWESMNMETNRIEYKARATRLRKAIQEMFGIDCKMSAALELVAKTENFPNWDALSGSAPASDVATHGSKNLPSYDVPSEPEKGMTAEFPSVEAIKALDGKIFSMLDPVELWVLNFYRAQGLKFGVSVSIINKADPDLLASARSQAQADEIMKSANSTVSVTINSTSNPGWFDLGTSPEHAARFIAGFNPLKGIQQDTDFVMGLLENMADIPITPEQKIFATKIALEEAAKGPVTFLSLITVWEKEPELHDFSHALRKALPGLSGKPSINPFR